MHPPDCFEPTTPSAKEGREQGLPLQTNDGVDVSLPELHSNAVVPEL
jgi:hypothetical protein